MKAKWDSPGQKIVVPVSFMLLSLAESLPPFMCGIRISPKDTLTFWGMSTEKNQEIKGESNVIKLSQIPEKILISDMCLKKFSLVSPIQLGLIIYPNCKFLKHFLLSKGQKETLYCKPALLCDLHQVSQPLWVASWPHAKFSTCASSQ